jgi:hypothetical protein
MMGFEKMKKILFLSMLFVVSIMTACHDSEEERRIIEKRKAMNKAMHWPFEEIRNFTDGELICDHSTGIVYFRYHQYHTSGMSVYLDEKGQPVRCEK